MIVTEEEAKTKWCQETRITASQGEWHTNRPSYADCDRKGFDLCIGSSCMAWCWDLSQIPAHNQTIEDFNESPERKGYCGKAHKP